MSKSKGLMSIQIQSSNVKKISHFPPPFKGGVRGGSECPELRSSFPNPSFISPTAAGGAGFERGETNIL